MMLYNHLKWCYIGRCNWSDTKEYERMQRVGSFKGSSLFLVGAAHTLENIKWNKNKKPKGLNRLWPKSARSPMPDRGEP
jgi:hypothetical protein